MMVQGEIEYQLKNFLKINQVYPKVILLNPATCRALEEEVLRSTNIRVPGGPLQYRGINVKRSLDVEVFKVEVY